MKRILLISNEVLHYRSRIYNVFFELFKSNGYEFHVISNKYQKVDFDIKYIKHEKSFSINGYIQAIKEINPDICINFLHLKDKLIIPLTVWCRVNKIPMIYWNHGINIKTPDAKLKNLIFKFIHTISSAIILYSPEQLKYIGKKNQEKTYIAKNTLDFSSVRRDELRSKEEIKKIYQIKEDKVVLYISRILPYKGLDILLQILKDTPNIGLVVVGGGINEEQKNIFDSTSNFYYLGEKYGKEVDEIYNMGDVFSTPGHIGLALNQAFYWGKPVVVLDRIHAPEIIYLKNKENGFIVNSEEELKNTIQYLLADTEQYKAHSESARETYEKEMKIENMFSGFWDAIKHVKKNSKK